MKATLAPMILVEILLILLAVCGNTILWVRIFDLLLARESALRLTLLGRLLALLLLAVLPLGFAGWYLQSEIRLTDQIARQQLTFPLAYLLVCWVMAIGTAPRWLRPHPGDDRSLLISNHSTLLDVGSSLPGGGVAGRIGHLARRLPGNQILQLKIHEEKIRMPALPKPLDGLTITHLTDLHFTGQIQKPFFEELVRHANRLHSDIIAITGDIVDRESCLDWLPDTLAKLVAPHGVYFVLGNHDSRIDSRLLRHRLVTECGMIDLGSRWIIRDLGQQRIVLAGNELPWFGPAPDMNDCPPRQVDGPARILLSHSPDQLTWARAHNFDLMLAGHTHGGQIQLPWTGPVVSATRLGRRFAAGLIYRPPTVLHVSRGISQTVPVRWRCPPELAQLQLTCA